MQTSSSVEKILLTSFHTAPKKPGSYSTEILLAAGAALFWMLALPLAALIIVAASLWREMSKMVRCLGRGLRAKSPPIYSWQ